MNRRTPWLLALWAAGCTDSGAGNAAADIQICTPEGDNGCLVATLGEETATFDEALGAGLSGVTGFHARNGRLSLGWPFTTEPDSFTCSNDSGATVVTLEGPSTPESRPPPVYAGGTTGGPCEIRLVDVRPRLRGTFSGAFGDGTPFDGSFDLPHPDPFIGEGRVTVVADRNPMEADLVRSSTKEDRILLDAQFTTGRGPVSALGVNIPLRGLGTWLCADVPEVGLGVLGGTEVWRADDETPESDCVVNVTSFGNRPGDLIAGTFSGTLAPIIEATEPLVLTDGVFSFPHP